MARDVELKKIELNVSVTCCDGCKRKVKKALRNIEGVLKTEIDPSKSKVTVLGNVDPQILIKKLLKVGKQAQVCSFQDYKIENKEAEVKKEKERAAQVMEGQEKVKPKARYEKEKHADPCGTKVENTKDVTECGKGDKNEASNKDEREIHSTNHPSEFQEIRKENFGVPLQPKVNMMTLHPSMNDGSNIKNQPQYCYVAEPCAVAIPYYAMRSYMAPPTIHSYGQPQPYLEFEKPRPPQPISMVPAVRVGDYFSDENTVGCSVM